MDNVILTLTPKQHLALKALVNRGWDDLYCYLSSNASKRDGLSQAELDRLATLLGADSDEVFELLDKAEDAAEDVTTSELAAVAELAT